MLFFSEYTLSLMARRRKHRTHLKGGAASNPGTAEGVPKSFIIKHGQIGSSLAQLVRDVRKVMEPNTATRLRVSIEHLSVAYTTPHMKC